MSGEIKMDLIDQDHLIFSTAKLVQDTVEVTGKLVQLEANLTRICITGKVSSDFINTSDGLNRFHKKAQNLLALAEVMNRHVMISSEELSNLDERLAQVVEKKLG